MNGFGRYTRALHYVSKLEENSRIDIKDFKEIQELKEKLKNTGAKLRSAELSRNIFFVFLYSSVASAFTSLIPGFEIITNNLVRMGSVIGSTISVIAIAVTSKMISVYLLDLNLISSHLISLYSKNVRRTLSRNKKK